MKSIELFGVSLLFLRGDDGEVRGFHNVCRHRGSRLVDDARGSVAAFTCPYHACTYDRQGALRGVHSGAIRELLEILLRHTLHVADDELVSEKRSMEAILPQGFEDLADLVGEWGLATTAERFAKRSASTLDEMKRFYDRVFPRMEAILTTLGTKPLDGLAEDERRLLALALSLAEVSLAVERYGAPLPIRGLPASRFVIAPNRLDEL